MWLFLAKGGVVLFIIAVLSIVAFAIVLAKFWSLWRFRTHLSTLNQRIEPQLAEGQYFDCPGRLPRIHQPAQPAV